MAAYLGAQAAAGAQALMLFESWAGLLAPREFNRFALRAVRRTMATLRKKTDVPLIYYVNQGSALMQSVADLDVDVIGVDWRSPSSECARILGPGKSVQGNLDPAALFAPPEELERSIDIVLQEGRAARGHIFNLGHGIWPETSPDAVARLVDYVHESSAKGQQPNDSISNDIVGNDCSAASDSIWPRAAGEYFRDLQSRICAAFEQFETDTRFEHRKWSKPEGHRLQGGGESRLMRGKVFEKVGVNFSHVWGVFSPQARGQVPGSEESEGRFVACGISLVAHMTNPYVPAVHMNLRYLHTSRGWFGGGSDLTPTFPMAEDTNDFHAALKAACDSYRPGCLRRVQGLV